MRQSGARKGTALPGLFSIGYNYFSLKYGACRHEAASSRLYALNQSIKTVIFTPSRVLVHSGDDERGGWAALQGL